MKGRKEIHMQQELIKILNEVPERVLEKITKYKPQKICKKCGNTNENDSIACLNCGQDYQD